MKRTRAATRALVPAPALAPSPLALQLPRPRALQAAIPANPISHALAGEPSPNTVRAYRLALEQFFGVDDVDSVPMHRIQSVSPADIGRWRDSLLAKGLKPSTVSNKMQGVRWLYDRCSLLGWVAYNPAHAKLVRTPKVAKVHKTDLIPWEDAIALLRAPDRSTRLGRRDYAMLMFALNLGLRRDELLGGRLEDLKRGPEGEYLYVRGKGGKHRLVTTEGRRDVKDALGAWLRDRGGEPGYIFPGRRLRREPSRPLDGSQFWRIVRGHAEAAGLFERGVHPHSLRAAFITFNFQKGTPIDEIQRTVGHSRGETTLGYARDLDMVKSRAVRALEGLNAEGKRP